MLALDLDAQPPEEDGRGERLRVGDLELGAAERLRGRGDDDAQRLDRDLISRATFTKRFEGSRTLNVEVDRQDNLDTGAVRETLPLIVFSQPNLPFAGRKSGTPGDTRGPGIMEATYFSLGGRFANDRNKPEEGPREDHVGSQVNVGVSSTASLSRFLTIRPALNGEATWIDEDKQGKQHALRATYGASVSGNTNIYGTYLGRLLADGYR